MAELGLELNSGGLAVETTPSRFHCSLCVGATSESSWDPIKLLSPEERSINCQNGRTLKQWVFFICVPDMTVKLCCRDLGGGRDG